MFTITQNTKKKRNYNQAVTQQNQQQFIPRQQGPSRPNQNNVAMQQPTRQPLIHSPQQSPVPHPETAYTHFYDILSAEELIAIFTKENQCAFHYPLV